MKFTCDREKMLAAFQTAASVSPSRSPKPILQNIKLLIGEGASTMLATDLEVGVRLEVPGIESEVPGEAILPVARFGAILRESTDERLSIETSDSGIVVLGGRSRFSLPAANPDEFPDVEQFDESGPHFCMSAAWLREAIRRTLFATDAESSRYALSGVLLEFEADHLFAVGTDGRRLALVRGECDPRNDAAPVPGIVPGKSMQLVGRTLAGLDNDAEVCVAVQPSHILVRTSKATVYARLLEGRFPKWRDVLPSRANLPIKCEIVSGGLYSSLRQASVVASDDSRGIDFQFGGGSLVLTGKTAEVGESRVDMPIQYTGEPQRITLDHRFVADFLKVIDSDRTVEFGLKNGESAVVMSDGNGYDYVLMPLTSD